MLQSQKNEVFSVIVWRESTEFHAFLMNSKRQVKGNLVTWYKYTFAVCRRR